jgi:hypothetical protein
MLVMGTLPLLMPGLVTLPLLMPELGTLLLLMPVPVTQLLPQRTIQTKRWVLSSNIQLDSAYQAIFVYNIHMYYVFKLDAEVILEVK